MRTQIHTSYRAFIAAGRPYLPVVRAKTLHLYRFALNAEKVANHNQKRLILQNVVVVNTPHFVAVYHEWYSRYGFRHRWLYWRDGHKVTWRTMTWDERRKVCLAYHKLNCIDYPAFTLKAPTKAWPEWVDLAVRWK